MIPFNTWVKGLIASCAKTHETNNFTQPQNIKNGITIDSDSLSDGYKGYVKFTNNGDVAGVYGHVSATGTKSVIIKAGSKKLGMGISDEGYPVSYCEHPIENGGDHQIATYGYVEDKVDDLDEDLDSITSRLTQLEDDVAGLITAYNSLNIPEMSQTPKTTETDKTISSAGVAIAIAALQASLTDLIRQTCKEFIENSVISSVNFGTPKEISVSGDNLTYTPTEPGLMIIKFYRKGSKCCTWYVNNVEKSVSGAGDGTVQQTYPCKADVEYKWHCDGGVSQALWIPLTFSVGEA